MYVALRNTFRTILQNKLQMLNMKISIINRKNVVKPYTQELWEKNETYLISDGWRIATKEDAIKLGYVEKPMVDNIEQPTIKPLSKMSAKELKEVAKNNNIDLGVANRKNTIMPIIKAALVAMEDIKQDQSEENNADAGANTDENDPNASEENSELE